MTTENLTKRLRLIESLLRDKQYEFALVLTAELEASIAKLQPAPLRCVPPSIRDLLGSLRTAAERRKPLVEQTELPVSA